MSAPAIQTVVRAVPAVASALPYAFPVLAVVSGGLIIYLNLGKFTCALKVGKVALERLINLISNEFLSRAAIFIIDLVKVVAPSFVSITIDSVLKTIGYISQIFKIGKEKAAKAVDAVTDTATDATSTLAIIVAKQVIDMEFYALYANCASRHPVVSNEILPPEGTTIFAVDNNEQNNKQNYASASDNNHELTRRRPIDIDDLHPYHS
ncbi:hypothetical protein BGZ46_005151 [Entomortierella lignicola]|nr:hypothetical protein BGZ46_005151 [Entomortierella lignicola]